VITSTDTTPQPAPTPDRVQRGRGAGLGAHLAGHLALIGATATTGIGATVGMGPAIAVAGLTAGGAGAAVMGRRLLARRAGASSNGGAQRELLGARQPHLGAAYSAGRRRTGGSLLPRLGHRRSPGSADGTGRRRIPGLSRLLPRRPTGAPGTRYNPNGGRVPGTGRVGSASPSTGSSRRRPGGSRLPGRGAAGTGRTPGVRSRSARLPGLARFSSGRLGSGTGRGGFDQIRPGRAGAGGSSPRGSGRGNSNTTKGGANSTKKRPTMRGRWNAWKKDWLTPQDRSNPHCKNTSDTTLRGGMDRILKEEPVTSSVRNGGSGASDDGKPAVSGGGAFGGIVAAAQQYVDALRRIDTSTARGKQQYMEQLAAAKELIADADQKIVGKKLGELWGDENITAAFANQARAGRQMAQGIRNVLGGFRGRNREKLEHIDNPGAGHARHGFDVSKNEGT
jgi:hypothetical protein